MTELTETLLDIARAGAGLPPAIRQLTTYEHDERFYQRTVDGEVVFAPSLTHILGETYPGDYGLSRWRGDVGNERADQLMREAGEEGTYVHDAIPRLFRGESIPSQDVRDRFYPPARALKVLRCLAAFIEWTREWQVEPLLDEGGEPEIERVTWCTDPRFAGTIDLVCWATNPKKDSEGRLYLVDFKSGKSIQEAHKAQVCGYQHSWKQDYTIDITPAILHLGNQTKRHWSFNVLDDDEVETYTRRCLAAIETYHLHHPDAKPNAETYPETFTLEPQP
jgi:hypothetical protein